MPEAARLSRDFFSNELLNPLNSGNTADYLQKLSKKLAAGLVSTEDYPWISMSNHHPQFLGKSEKLLRKNFSDLYRTGIRDPLHDSQVCIAREYGYENWDELRRGEKPFSENFEKALAALLKGDLKLLQELLKEQPGLCQAISPFGHQAKLLHYAASNGVEIWRQIVPANLEEGVRLLLNYGARPEALMKAYGGTYDVLALLDSSAHPRVAGCYEAVHKVLTQ